MDMRTERVRDLIDRMKPTGRGFGIQRRVTKPGYRRWEDQMGDLIEREVQERGRAQRTADKARIEELEDETEELRRQIEQWKKYRGPSDQQP